MIPPISTNEAKIQNNINREQINHYEKLKNSATKLKRLGAAVFIGGAVLGFFLITPVIVIAAHVVTYSPLLIATGLIALFFPRVGLEMLERLQNPYGGILSLKMGLLLGVGFAGVSLLAGSMAFISWRTEAWCQKKIKILHLPETI